MENYFIQIICEHDLKCCEKCNTVYCTKCGREWLKPKYISTVYSTPYSTSGQGYMVIDCRPQHICKEE